MTRRAEHHECYRIKNLSCFSDCYNSYVNPTLSSAMRQAKYTFALCFAFVSLVCALDRTASAAPAECKSTVGHAIGSYEHFTISDHGPAKRKRGYVCWIVQDHPRLVGAITLRNTSNSGDWDLIVGHQLDADTKTVHGTIPYDNNKGTKDELLRLPSSSSRQLVVVAYPRSSTPSEACLTFHRIDPKAIAAEAVLMATVQTILEGAITGSSSSSSERALNSRVVATGLAVLRQQNLAAVGKEVALNEISLQLSEQFGGGSWLFTLGLNFFSGYLDALARFASNQRNPCKYFIGAEPSSDRFFGPDEYSELSQLRQRGGQQFISYRRNLAKAAVERMIEQARERGIPENRITDAMFGRFTNEKGEVAYFNPHFEDLRLVHRGLDPRPEKDIPLIEDAITAVARNQEWARRFGMISEREMFRMVQRFREQVPDDIGLSYARAMQDPILKKLVEKEMSTVREYSSGAFAYFRLSSVNPESQFNFLAEYEFYRKRRYLPTLDPAKP